MYAARVKRAVVVACAVCWSAVAAAQPAPDAGPPVEAPPEADAGPPTPEPDAAPPPVEEPPKIEQPAPPQRHTAASVKDAPRPEEARGLTRDEPGPGTGRSVARILLLPVRALLWVVAAPVRGSLWLYERYRLRDRWKAIFFNDEGTVGIYPVAFFEAGFDSGQLMGDLVELELEAQYEIRPHDQFFGIGNGDLSDGVAAPIDPYDDPTAVDSRFQQTVGRLSALADVLLAGPVSARV